MISSCRGKKYLRENMPLIAANENLPTAIRTQAFTMQKMMSRECHWELQ